MKKGLLVILSILCLILCLGLASCGGTEDYVTITFDTKGGSGIDSIQVEKGGKIPNPQDPTKEGYTLNGWCYGGEQWSFVGCVATEDMTLEASWTPITYTIEYIGQVNHTNKTTYTVENELELSDSNKEYYEFLGWYEDQEYTKPISKIEKGTTGNLKLYGKTEYTGIKLELKQDGYAVVDCDKNATSIVIPESYKGLKVTSIDGDVFSGRTGLTSVTIPNSITSIGNNAFDGCTSLARVDISDIGAWCNISFGNSYANPLSYAKNLYSNGVLVTDLVIPNSVTSIGYHAFVGCAGLTSVTIGNSVTSIGSGAFGYCTGLTSVTIGDSVTTIGTCAFEGCTGLTSVTIGDSVTTFGKRAFYGCTGLINIVIPNSLTTIDSWVFYGCTGLTSIVIPNSLTTIGWNAFSGCTGLTSIVIPNSVTSIDSNAFNGCTGLTIYCEAESEPSFWDNDWNDSNCPVVWNCKNNDVADNGRIYLVDDGVRYSIYEGKAIVGIQSTAITTANIKEKISYKGNEYAVIYIGSKAFSGCEGLTSVTIPNSVTTIGEDAFRLCKGLTSIVIPNSVTSIGEGAFYNCTGLTSVVIPNSVTTIGKNAFEDCKGLTSVTIGNSVTSIGSSAFGGCTGLTSIIVDEENPSYKSIEGNLYSKDGKTLILYAPGKKDTAFAVPNSVTSIGDDAFYYCTGLTSVVIPNSVTTIGYRAFYNCTGLTSVTIPNSVTSIGNSAFYNCTNLTSVVIPNSVTTIGWSAFEGCTGLTSIVIPNSVTTIGFYAFRGCTGLTSIVIPNSVTTIGERAFYNCTSLTIYCEAESEPGGWNIDWNIDLIYSKCPVVWNCKNNDVANNGKIYLVDDGVRYSIYEGKATVEGQSNAIATANIKEKISYEGNEYTVTTIVDSAFVDCTRLTSVEIPNSVTSIGEYAFYGCTGLTSIVIPNSVTTIGHGAFWDCTSLIIYCEAERKPSGWDVDWNSSWWYCSHCPVVWGHEEN